VSKLRGWTFLGDNDGFEKFNFLISRGTVSQGLIGIEIGAFARSGSRVGSKRGGGFCCSRSDPAGLMQSGMLQSWRRFLTFQFVRDCRSQISEAAMRLLFKENCFEGCRFSRVD
jgi:hypothetical protein